MARALIGMGLQERSKNEYAHICIINTCAVTHVAAKKCRQTINHATRMHPIVIVTGCYAALQACNDNISAHSAIVYIKDKHTIPQAVEQLLSTIISMPSDMAQACQHDAGNTNYRTCSPSVEQAVHRALNRQFTEHFADASPSVEASAKCTINNNHTSSTAPTTTTMMLEQKACLNTMHKVYAAMQHAYIYIKRKLSHARHACARMEHASRGASGMDTGTQGFYAAYSLHGRTRSFLKAQDGCNYGCSYCAVPLARGRSRSASIGALVQQASAIAAAGVKEIVLTGINLGAYDGGGGACLLDLLHALQQIAGIERYRLSSIEPNLLSENIINFVASAPKMMPHFHIPLQSGSDRILRLMRRRYTTDLFRQKLAYIGACMPHAFVGVDVIAGFPSERDDDFAASVSLLREVGAAYVHAFPFSVREGTLAAAMRQLPHAVIMRRARMLGVLCGQLHAAFVARHVGLRMDVLFEGAEHDGMMAGYTPNYIRVERPFDAALVNQIVQVQV
jgi:MiaB/RimO family radical SAM methylthiotransferase